MPFFDYPSTYWPYRLTVRTEPSQGLNQSSILCRVTEERASSSTRQGSKLANKSKSDVTCFCCSLIQRFVI